MVKYNIGILWLLSLSVWSGSLGHGHGFWDETSCCPCYWGSAIAPKPEADTSPRGEMPKTLTAMGHAKDDGHTGYRSSPSIAPELEADISPRIEVPKTHIAIGHAKDDGHTGSSSNDAFADVHALGRAKKDVLSAKPGVEGGSQVYGFAFPLGSVVKREARRSIMLPRSNSNSPLRVWTTRGTSSSGWTPTTGTRTNEVRMKDLKASRIGGTSTSASGTTDPDSLSGHVLRQFPAAILTDADLPGAVPEKKDSDDASVGRPRIFIGDVYITPYVHLITTLKNNGVISSHKAATILINDQIKSIEWLTSGQKKMIIQSVGDNVKALEWSSADISVEATKAYEDVIVKLGISLAKAKVIPTGKFVPFIKQQVATVTTLDAASKASLYEAIIAKLEKTFLKDV